MANKSIIIIAIIVFITLSFVLIVPITFISFGLSSYGIINESKTFKYMPNTPSSIEKLNLHVDFGNIEIRYVDPSVDYFVKIDMNIGMIGAGLVEKSYKNFFKIIKSDTTTTPINFSIELHSNITKFDINSLVKDISVIVSLRKDIIFEISANIIYGNVKLNVPFNVHSNNLKFNVTHGDIRFDLKKCVVEGNITGICNNGKITFKSLDVVYTQNSVWSLFSNETNIEITQKIPMGANITGTISTTTLDKTYLTYYDSTSKVGAKVTLYNYLYPSIDFNSTCENFDFYEEPEGISRWTFISDDFYTANNSFILGLHLEGILIYKLFNT